MEKIETKRLLLRPLAGDDRDAIVKLLNDFEVSQWLTVVPYPYTAADFKMFLEYLRNGSALEGMAIQSVEGVIGVIGIGETLGYWMGRPFHGNGYMTEAAQALVHWYFRNTKSDVLMSGCFEGNTASYGILQKLGFIPTGVVEIEHSLAQGRDVPLIQMHLSRSEWSAQR